MPFYFLYRLRSVLPLMLGGTAVIGSLLVVLIYDYSGIRNYRENTTAELRVYSFALRNTLSDLLGADYTDIAERRFTDATLDNRVNNMALVGPQGTVIFSTRREWIGRAADSIPEFDRLQAMMARELSKDSFEAVEKNRLIGYFPLAIGRSKSSLRDIHNGVLFVDYDFSLYLSREWRNLWMSSLWILFFWLLLAGLLFLLLDFLFTRKVDRIFTVMREAESGRLDARCCLTGLDELSRVGSALDRLLDRIGSTQKELRASSEFLDTILESLPMMVFVKTAKDLRYVRLNRAGESLLGFTRSEMLGKSDFDFFPSEQAEFFTSKDKEVISCRRSVEILEEHVQTRHRGNRLLHTIKVPVLDEHGQPIYLMGLSDDITDRRALEQQVARSQKMDSLGNLAGGVAHDMNNVLSAIQGIASIHAEGMDESEEVKKSMETIVRACQRGARLVKGLLGFARQELAEEKVLDLNALVREEVALLERTTLRRIRITMELGPALHPIKGDPAALSHVLMNLCVNAVDAMPNGGTLTIRTFNEERGGVRMEVVDTGCGMNQDILNKALDPFFTTKPTGKGTGLGLSIVYGTIKAHRGKLDLQSIVGEGTTVRIHLPSCLRRPGSVTGVETVGALQPKRVLLVDDDELFQRVLGQIFESLGNLTTITDKAEDALRILASGQNVDLVVLDMDLPGMDGMTALARIREERPHLPILLATGKLHDMALELARSAPKVRYLAKPFTLEELERVIEELKV